MAKKTASNCEHSVDFYAHHSPFGANASFTLGRLGKTGGFGLELGRPAGQDVIVAYNRKGEKPCALPFFEGAAASLEAFAMQDQAPKPKMFFDDWRLFKPSEIARYLGWASDTWQAGDVTFRLLSPFGEVEDPAVADVEETRLAVLPAILAEIEFDNSKSSKPAWVFFGVTIRDGLTGMRMLSPTAGGDIVGIAGENKWGLAAYSDQGRVEEVQCWFLDRLLATGVDEKQGLPRNGGLMLHVPARKKASLTVALGFYRGGTVTSGLETSYYYSRFYPNLESVLQTALEHAEDLKALAADRDAELKGSGLTPSQQFLLAHASHSYYGSSQLLSDGGEPLWVVNEGEYQMINTFDLTVDHLFHELMFHPWAVRNALDLFVNRYRYYDNTIDVLDGRKPHKGGISFCHDMGICNQFMAAGTSSYEIPEKTGGFSFMTHEQLVNWVLTASTYGLTQGDHEWMILQQGVFKECLESMLNRDHENPAKRTGVMAYDSACCGKTGQEITTYDSLDTSLGQSRNNLYLAVKSWAAYLALEKVLGLMGESDGAKIAALQAKLAARTISSKMDRKAGFIPAVFDENNSSRIIPAVEGLVFPYITGDLDAVSEKGRFGKLIADLKTHIKTIMKVGVCIDATSGGWQMSSTSTNTWASKIALSQYVVRQVLGMRFGKAEEGWDRAHCHWQQIGCADWAFTDQIRSTDGKDLGSRYYPRGVTSTLWLIED